MHYHHRGAIASGLCVFSPRRHGKGAARRKAQASMVSAILRDRGGRLSARHMRSFSLRYRVSRYLSACSRRTP
jgi:hypothetical protein